MSLIERLSGWPLSAKLFEHIKKVTLPSTGPNWEAEAIFLAIEFMFDGTGGGHFVTTDSYLVHNLAACACIALQYDRHHRIPLDKNDHDAIIIRTLVGMVNTLCDAVRKGAVRKVNGKTLFGDFEIPDWLIQEALTA